MDWSEEGDFALLLPAKEAAIPKKIGEQIKKHINKHTNITYIIYLTTLSTLPIEFLL